MWSIAICKPAAARGLLSFLSLLRAFLLSANKRNFFSSHFQDGVDLKKGLIGVRLKSTRRSHTKGFTHTSLRVLRFKKDDRGCPPPPGLGLSSSLHAPPTAQRNGGGRCAARYPWRRPPLARIRNTRPKRFSIRRHTLATSQGVDVQPPWSPIMGALLPDARGDATAARRRSWRLCAS